MHPLPRRTLGGPPHLHLERGVGPQTALLPSTGERTVSPVASCDLGTESEPGNQELKGTNVTSRSKPSPPHLRAAYSSLCHCPFRGGRGGVKEGREKHRGGEQPPRRDPCPVPRHSLMPRRPSSRRAGGGFLGVRRRRLGLLGWGTGGGGLSEEPTWLCSPGTVAALSERWPAECGGPRGASGGMLASLLWGVGRPGLDRHRSSGHRWWEGRDHAWKAGGAYPGTEQTRRDGGGGSRGGQRGMPARAVSAFPRPRPAAPTRPPEWEVRGDRACLWKSRPSFGVGSR